MSAQDEMFAYGSKGETRPIVRPTEETRREAKKAIEPRAANLREVVLGAIRSSGGATGQQLEALTGLSGNTVRPRLRELEVAGRIKQSGETRATASGRQAAVYVVAK